MIFSFETQGAITYLVCELEPMEMLDTLTLGMLTNNHIAGVAPVLYTEMNGVRYLKYNISAKITSEQFFSGSVNKDRLFTSLQNITNALCVADEYMIDQACFSFLPEHVFLNVSSCETALICVPVAGVKDVNAETNALFKKLLSSVQASPAESGYIAKLLDFIDNTAVFNIYSFNDYLRQLKTEPIAPMSAGNAAAMSSFDSTISIDDMPGLMKSSGQPVIQPPVQPAIQPPVQPSIQPPVQPVRPMQPPVQPSIQPSVPNPPVQQMKSVQPPVYATPASVQTPVFTSPAPPAQPPVNRGVPGGYPGFNNAPAGQAGSVPGRPANVPPAPAPAPAPAPTPRNNPGFAIPGQSFGAPATPEAEAGKKKKKEKKEKAPKQPKAEAPVNAGEKKMSFMTLMAHYNKENAAIYKAQKEAAKQEKENAKANANPVSPVAPPPNQFGFGGQGNVPPQNGMSPAFVPPPVQPLPVQNSFNETTVLSNFTGETTVLSGAAPVSEPALIRVKTGERVVVNKPVFRIGKEKSYVDYFIGDNTAISRSHANIHIENGEYFIEDTNSTNHTYINGNIIVNNVKNKITNGDKIKLANEEFIFSC